MKNKRLDLSYSQMKWETIFKRILIVMSVIIADSGYRHIDYAHHTINAIDKIIGYRIFMGKSMGPG